MLRPTIQARLRMMIVILALLAVNGEIAVGLCQTVSPPMTVGYKSGQVTEVRPPSSIEIDERSYELRANVMIVDREGEPLELARILPTSLVKFHLKEGKIDKMVVTLPQ
ncbi:MAG TPA: hypothetical protein VJ805_09955 [Nitrospiraceae bacterium]|nr:hypothetical protein [Nitrospiraceae bacterium]